MNPVVVQIANGNAFFIGVGMTVAAFALYIWAKKRWQIFLINIGWLLGIGLVIISAAPISNVRHSNEMPLRFQLQGSDRYRPRGGIDGILCEGHGEN